MTEGGRREANGELVRECVHFSFDVLLHEIVIDEEELLDGDIGAQVGSLVHLSKITLANSLPEIQIVEIDLPLRHLANTSTNERPASVATDSKNKRTTKNSPTTAPPRQQVHFLFLPTEVTRTVARICFWREIEQNIWREKTASRSTRRDR
jgi:hypothetical protein